MARLVFVYGTLMKGFGLHRCLPEGSFVSGATIKGRLYTLGGCPGLRPGEDVVRGEVYRVSDKDMRLLDAIELGAGYTRQKVIATTGSEEVEVETYFYRFPLPEWRRISSGSWREYTGR